MIQKYDVHNLSISKRTTLEILAQFPLQQYHLVILVTGLFRLVAL